MLAIWDQVQDTDITEL